MRPRRPRKRSNTRRCRCVRVARSLSRARDRHARPVSPSSQYGQYTAQMGMMQPGYDMYQQPK